jgi:type IV pilus assembly protein PilP
MIKKLPLKNSHFLMTVFTFACLLQLTACGEKQVQAPVQAPTQVPKPVVQPKPIQKPTSSSLRLPVTTANQFDFSNKKDPFKPFVAIKIESKSTPESKKQILHNSLPIHSFDVSQFKLIGIITGGRENQAMVTDPGGKGYVLKVGMLIGKNDGKIISISSNGVDVLEQFKDDNGRVRKENIKLTLPRKQ